MKTTISNFAANYVQSQTEAFDKWVGFIQRDGKVGKDDAVKVLNYYIKRKWAKFDHMQRTYTIRSGNMLDKSFIKSVLEVVNAKKA
jgi:hypothetical protein